MKMTRTTILSGSILLLALTLSSCGGGSRAQGASRVTTSTGATTTVSRSLPQPSAGTTETQQTGTKTTQQPGMTATSAPLAEATNGIEAFGYPAGGLERAAVATALHGYTVALATDDGAVACAQLAAPIRAQALNTAARQAQDESCAQLLTSMFAGQAPQTRAAMRHIEIDGVRVEGDRAFALIHQAGTPESFYPLQREQGQWKIAALGPTTLPVVSG
jgi:hypothetical protein